MAEGTDNTAFTTEDQERRDTYSLPPSYPGTPTNFDRKVIRVDYDRPPPTPTPTAPTQGQGAEIPEKSGPPPSFVEVTLTLPGSMTNDMAGPLPSKQQYTVIEDTKELTKEPKKKNKATCRDVTGLLLAIVACVLFFPLGIPALVLSILSIVHRRKSRTLKANKFTKISLVLSIIGICLFAVAMAVAGAFQDEHEDCEGATCPTPTRSGSDERFWDDDPHSTNPDNSHGDRDHGDGGRTEPSDSPNSKDRDRYDDGDDTDPNPL